MLYPREYLYTGENVYTIVSLENLPYAESQYGERMYQFFPSVRLYTAITIRLCQVSGISLPICPVDIQLFGH